MMFGIVVCEFWISASSMSEKNHPVHLLFDGIFCNGDERSRATNRGWLGGGGRKMMMWGFTIIGVGHPGSEQSVECPITETIIPLDPYGKMARHYLLVINGLRDDTTPGRRQKD